MRNSQKDFKKVLMIAYIFPPLTGAGVHRTVKFAKYLPQNKWIPVVLSTTSTEWPHYNPDDYRNEIPSNIKVFRTRCFNTRFFMPILFRVTRKISRGLRKLFKLIGLQSKSPAVDTETRFFERWESGISNLLTIPDNRIGWFFSALPKALKIIFADNIRVIYSTSFPYSSHLIGFALRVITRKPWVADFRDAWTDNAIFNEGKPEWVRRIHIRLEKRVLHRADKVVAVSDSIIKGFLKKHTNVNPKKFVVIPNGFDFAEFENIDPIKSDRFVISYIGELYASRSPEVMLEAFARFVQRIPRESVILRIIGSKDENSRMIIQESVSKYNLEDLIELHGYLSHNEALRYMLGSNLLIFILGTNETSSGGVCPGKVFEYLAAQKPVLGITPPGEAADLIKELNAGFICDNQDVDCVEQIFLRGYTAYLRNERAFNLKGDIAKYDRKALTQELAKVFDSVSK